MVDVSLSGQKFDEKKFNRFCQKYGFIFPTSYLLFLEEFNDASLESNVIQGFEENEGFFVRAFYGTTVEEHSDINSTYLHFIDRMPVGCVPIADDDFGNQICISLKNENYGKIYFWDHETMDTDDGETCTLTFDDMVLLSDSFDEFLKKIVPYELDNLIKEKPSFFEKLKSFFM